MNHTRPDLIPTRMSNLANSHKSVCRKTVRSSSDETPEKVAETNQKKPAKKPRSQSHPPSRRGDLLFENPDWSQMDERISYSDSHDEDDRSYRRQRNSEIPVGNARPCFFSIFQTRLLTNIPLCPGRHHFTYINRIFFAG